MASNATDTASIIASLPKPSQDVINLSLASIIFSAVFLVICGWIAWKHGKAGMVCWQIVIMTFVAKIVADVYQVVTKDQPMIPSAVSTMAGAAVLTCISLGLIGIIYEANTILPTPPKYWTYKIILGATHLSNTAGIGMAMYGGTASAEGEDGVKNKTFEQIGSLMMLWVIFAVCGWMWPTWKKIQSFEGRHPNARPAKMLWFGGAAAMPFWLTRLGYQVLYAFEHTPALNSVMGTFATKLCLIFFPYIGASIALLAGGWLANDLVPVGQAEVFLSDDEQHLYRNRTEDSSDMEMGLRK